MRLFIVINLSEDTRGRLLTLRDELRSYSRQGNFSLPENLHLTLAFLGECDARQTTAIKAVMDVISFESFEMMIERIGRFKREGGDVWWAGIRDNKILFNLQQNLTAGLRARDFILDKRKYSPHITLGREVISEASPRQIDPFGETVSNIELMKSERIGGKLTYTAIYKKGAKT